MMILPSLYIPGPVNVSEEVMEAFRSPMMAHRSADFKELSASCQPMLKQIVGTSRPVYMISTPATQMMEATARNLCAKKALCCICGAFSERWFDILQRSGKQADILRVEWNECITPDVLKKALNQGDYDLVTLVHAETSTGVLNPLKELAKVVHEYSEQTLLAVDMVSSLSAVPCAMDNWGVDLIFAGVQKAFALPPGMCVVSASEKALERAASLTNRGGFTDLLDWEKNAQGNMTVATPSIGHFWAMSKQMELMAQEGLSNRFQRHFDNQSTAQVWAKKQGLALNAPEGYRTNTLTCFQNTQHWDMPTLIKRLHDEHHILIDGGYGLLKGKTFRISHMGHETPVTLTRVLDLVTEVSGSL